MTSPPKVQSAEPSPVDVFLRATLRSGLLDAQQLQQALNGTPSAIRGKVDELADYMVKVGHLSRFQAHKLIQGVSFGLVLGPYHLLAQIGRGGMGAVYLARDTRNQGLLAVKVLPPKRAKAQERLLARFRREMEVCQRVFHPNLTRTFEVGVHQEVNYIAMEYIPGKNLYRLVHERGPLDVPRAARLFSEVCDGLEHAHAQGLIHRDLKPSNILITPTDHAKVLDLGLALIQGEIAEERTIVGGQGYVVGTMDYLAPEQAEDPFGVDARSDLYSLGATIYFTLTGQPPFPGGNALQKMLRHRTEEPVPLRSLQPSVPVGFEELVKRMMAKDPGQRFANAVEVRAALKPWVGELLVATPVGPPRVVAPLPSIAPPSPPGVAIQPAPVKAASEGAAIQPRPAPPAPPPPLVKAPVAPVRPPPPTPPVVRSPAVAAPVVPPAPPRPSAPAVLAPVTAPVAPAPVAVAPANAAPPVIAPAPPQPPHPPNVVPNAGSADGKAAPSIPLAAPIEDSPGPPLAAPVVPSLRDPRFAGGGAQTMKISRGALLAGAYDFEADAVQAAPAAPAEELPAANPFAFDNAIPAAAPVSSPVVFPPSEVRAPLVAPPPLAPAVTPTAAAPPTADGDLPFWIDFGLPVAGAALILFILWVMVLALFLY